MALLEFLRHESLLDRRGTQGMDWSLKLPMLVEHVSRASMVLNGFAMAPAHLVAELDHLPMTLDCVPMTLDCVPMVLDLHFLHIQ